MENPKFYMSRYINNSWEEEVSIEDYFEGMKYSKCDGLSTFGKPKNIYTESYAEGEKLRVYIPPTVVRENTDIEFEFIFSGENRRSVYNSFVDWITGYKIKYRDTCRGKEVEMILIESIEPEDDFLYGSDPYMASVFKFKNLIGSSVDNGGIEPDVCPTLEELTIDGTATESDIAVGKVAYSKGVRITGTMHTSIDVYQEGIFFAYSTFKKVPDIFDFSRVVTIQQMFNVCISLSELPKIPFEQIINSTSAFSECISLQGDINIKMPNCSYARKMFYNTKKLNSIVNLVIGKVSDCSNILQYSGIKSISNIELPECINLEYSFYGCENLQSISFNNTTKVQSYGNSFNGCISLTTINSINFSQTNYTYNAFIKCSLLTKIGNIIFLHTAFSLADSPNLDNSTLDLLGTIATEKGGVGLAALKTLGLPRATLTLNTSSQSYFEEQGYVAKLTDENWTVSFADSM